MAVFLSPVFGVAGQVFDDNGNPLAGGKIYTYLAGTTTPAATYTTSLGSIAHTNPIVLDGAGRVPSGEIWLTDGIVYKFVVEDANSVLIGTYDNITGINSNFVAFSNEQEIQTATAGQTVFNLTTMQYQPGTNSLSVFVDGVNQYGPGAQYAYVETSSTVITFVSGLHVGASVKFTTSQLNSSGATDAALVSYDPPFTGSVITNVEDKLAQTISVKDFGATGDGVTDDTAAIQAALDAMPNEGGKLFFPTGTYIVSASLILPAKSVDRLRPIYICGESSSISPESIGSIISYTASSGTLFQGRDSSGTGTRRGIMGFRDIQLYGQYQTGVSSTNTSTGINLYRSTGLQMKNVLIYGFKYGLVLSDFWYYSNFNYCRFIRCEYGVYSVNGLANGSAFTNCSFSTFDQNAMYLQAAIGEGLFISQCWFETAAQDQIRISSTGRKIVVRDCYFEYAGSGYAVNWIRENDPTDKTFNLVFEGNFVSCASSADAIVYANNASPNPQTASITISNINCQNTGSATEFLKQTGATSMSVVFLNKITYTAASGGTSLPPSLSTAARYEETMENVPIGTAVPNSAVFTQQYLKQSNSIYAYDTQEIVNYKTNVTDGVAFNIFQFAKFGSGGASSDNYVSCGGMLEISYCARNSAAGTARVATERIPINLGSVAAGNIALATGTPVIIAAVAGTNCTIALSLSSTSSTSATLACSLTIASGTLAENDLTFKLNVSNAADSNSRIMAITAV